MNKREYHVVNNFELVRIFLDRTSADDFIFEQYKNNGIELDLMVCDIREEK